MGAYALCPLGFADEPRFEPGLQRIGDAKIEAIARKCTLLTNLRLHVHLNGVAPGRHHSLGFASDGEIARRLVVWVANVTFFPFGLAFSPMLRGQWRLTT